LTNKPTFQTWKNKKPNEEKICGECTSTKKKKNLDNIFINIFVVYISVTVSNTKNPLNSFLYIATLIHTNNDSVVPFSLILFSQNSAMSITSFKSLTMAESCLLSQPSLFHTKTKSSFISNSAKSFKIQNPSYNSSKFSQSISLTISNRRTRDSSFVTFVAQTSDWTQEEKEDGAWENQGETAWVGETETAESDGDVGRFEEPSEELKIFVGNLPFDVDSDKLAELFEQAGTVEVAEVSSYFF
jgi:hypothetical protein